MELKLWHTIVSACGEVRQMLDGKNPTIAPEVQASDATIVVSHSVSLKGGLRSEIRAKLDQLRVDLAKVLSEREVFFVLFPLTIHYDELVLRRLPPNEQTAWPLLQSERFAINDGGDKFYSFADERLANPDTPPLVFEVLYFCLSDGFIGRYANDPARIAGYKSNLAARIPTPKTPAMVAKRNAQEKLTSSSRESGQGRSGSRNGDESGRDGKKRGERTEIKRGSAYPAPRPVVPLLYVAAATVVVLMPLVLVWLSNL